MSMSASTKIYIARKRETSNVLYALVRSKHKRFQMLSECVSANTRIAHVIWQRIPHRWTNRRKNPSGSGASPAAWNDCNVRVCQVEGLVQAKVGKERETTVGSCRSYASIIL